jgi:hypothetical protein
MNHLSTKASILQHLYDAKYAHKDWVKKAERLVKGLNGYKGDSVEWEVDKTFIPLDSTDCDFGKWFRSHSTHLSRLDKIGSFVNRIEEHHNQLHETYADIYAIFFVIPQNRSLLHKLLTFNSKKISAEEREKAKIHLTYLKRSSKELLEVIDVLESKIKSLEYTDLKRLISE